MLEDKNYNNILVQQNNIDLTDINETLASLSPEEKEAVLTILKEYATNGNSQTLSQLENADWEEIPVDIDEFLDNDDYLGKSIWEVDKATGEKRDTLFPYWRNMLHKLFPTNTKTAYNTVILTGGIGLGKEQPISALVLTKNGFVPMGKITVGTKVFGRDGQLHNVIAVFPQGIKDVYEVTFTDGSKTRCGENHLWTVTNHHKKVHGKIKAVTQTLTLKEILKYKLHSSCYNFEIPMCNAMDFQKQTHLISPYLLGLLLGDGCFKGNLVSFCSADQELLDAVNNEISLNGYTLHGKIRNKLFEGRICKIVNKKPFNNIYKDELVRLGLFDTNSATKFIPQEYLYTSIEERVAILQGLTDTDGCAYHIHARNGDDHYNTTFSTCSAALKNDFVWLVQSLGGTARVTVKQGKYKDKYGQLHLTKINYIINFFLPSKFKPFRLKRKLDKYNSCQHREPVRYIKEIKKLDYKEESQCILLDGEEHLYLTDNFIVTHNTLVACVIQLYLLYRMLCLKDPYAYYGMMPMDKITFSMLNVTIDAAKGVAWDKEQQMLQASPWFLSHGQMNASRVAPQWQPGKHIELIFGSNNNHVVGRALFNNTSDEVNFTVGGDAEKKKKKLLKMISQIDARMISRFAKGTFLPTVNTIISSADSEQSFLNSYINLKRKNDSKTTLIINEPQWVVRNDKGTPDDPGAFWVAIGDKFHAHELLPVGASEEEVDKFRAKGYTMLKVPPIFRETFEDNLDQALMDVAGVSGSASTRYISGERLNEIKSNLYQNPFTKDIIEVGNAPDDYLQYANFFDLSRVNPQDMSRPLFIHMDLSVSGDKTGIAGVWITGKKPTKEGEDPSREMYYKLAFSVSIKAPKGFQVSFEKTRNFIRWLKDRGFAIKSISSDTYAAPQMHQELKSDGFKTEIISVDRVNSQTHQCEPYAYFKSAIYEHKVVMYSKCDLLTEEIVNLERESDGHINHPENGQYGSKDQSDGFCLSENTEIFLTSGHKRTIKDLYANGFNNEYILAYDTENQNIVVEPIMNIVYNGNKEVIKLTLDNGKELICTPDHKLLTRNGSYIEAKDALNVSLMPFNYEQKIMFNDRDYTYIWIPKKDNTSTGIYLHKLVAEQFHNKEKLEKLSNLQKKEWVVIHHKDINRLNNNPDNLEYLTNVEHSKIHTSLNSTPEKRQQLSVAGKKNYVLGISGISKMTKEERQLAGKNSLTKWNKSNRHRQLVSEKNKELVALGKHNFQLYKKAAHTKEANEKREATFKAKYGEVGFKSNIIQQKCRQSCLLNNGYDNPWHSKEKQHEMQISKLKNAFNKIVTKYDLELNSGISLIDFKIYCYRENIQVSCKQADIKEANIFIISNNFENDINYYNNKIRPLGNLIKRFIKDTFKNYFTLQELKDYFENKCKEDKKFKHQFCYIDINNIDLSLILKLGFNLYNHRVVKIENVGVQEVYDLQLANIHNFALTNGIFVHNCGALWNASKYAEEYAYNYGENLDASIEATMLGVSDISRKSEMIANFQEELTRAYQETFKELDEVSYEDRQKKIEENNYYKNLRDGIIVL